MPACGSRGSASTAYLPTSVTGTALERTPWHVTERMA